MHPEICSIGPFTIYSYGLMLALAFIVSVALVMRQARKENIDTDTVYNLAFLALICGIAGARIFYVLENLDFYLKSPLEILMLQRGGLSWFGGLILGSLAALVYLKKKKLGVYRVLDLFAPFVALAQGIGRIGCLLNGCCFGKASAYGFYFPALHERLIPTQLYSSVILVLIYFFLRFLQKRPHQAGQIFYAYLLLYSIKRFFIEFWRADNPEVIAGLTLFQLISAAIFLFSAYKLLRISRRG